MSPLLRLAGQRASPLLLSLSRQPIGALARTASLRSVTPKVPDTQNYDDRNMKLGRPQSPHLTIYAPQLTSMLSITHRMTGVGLAVLTTTFAISLLFSPYLAEDIIVELESWKPVGPWLLEFARWSIALPIAYHTCNGIRHLLWDMGFFLTLKQVYITGYIMVVCAIILAGLILCSVSGRVVEDDEEKNKKDLMK